MQTSPIVFNPFDPVWKADPYPFYRRLREEAPIGQVPGVGSWYVARFADCEALLKDRRVGSDTRKSDFYRKLAEQRPIRLAEDATERRSFLFLDPPEHTRLRGLVAGAFTPRVLARLVPAVERLVGELLDAAVARGRFDVVEDLAYPLAFSTISEILGIPHEDQGRFRAWSNEMAGSNDPTMNPSPEVVERQGRAYRETMDYLRALVAERRARPRDDVVSNLAAAERDGQLSEDEILSSITLLVASGHESTVSLIGNAVHALLTHPDQLAQLQASPELATNAIEETLRWDAPVQMTRRVAHEEIELGGRVIAKGFPITLVLGAANRDEAANPDGERFDIRRDPVRHLAFGMGPHFCLGTHLARVEGSVALTAMIARFPSMRLGEAGVRRRTDLVMRGLQSLPLAV